MKPGDIVELTLSSPDTTIVAVVIKVFTDSFIATTATVNGRLAPQAGDREYTTHKSTPDPHREIVLVRYESIKFLSMPEHTKAENTMIRWKDTDN